MANNLQTEFLNFQFQHGGDDWPLHPGRVGRDDQDRLREDAVQTERVQKGKGDDHLQLRQGGQLHQVCRLHSFSGYSGTYPELEKKLRQEMYKEGRACSDCPSGTSCSKRYKGLCTGDPGGAAPEPVNPDENPDENETKPSPKPNPSTKPSQKPDPDRSDCDGNCKYECKPNDGGCKVRYKNYGSGYSGSISGYCWSEKFGGECDGTPHCCKKCKEWCEEEKGTSEENESKKCIIMNCLILSDFMNCQLIKKIKSENTAA